MRPETGVDRAYSLKVALSHHFQEKVFKKHLADNMDISILGLPAIFKSRVSHLFSGAEPVCLPCCCIPKPSTSLFSPLAARKKARLR